MKARNSGTLALVADWLLPISAAPLRNGAVVIKNAEVAAVMERRQLSADSLQAKIVDYGQAVILPGLINLHTHLDYTSLRLLDTRSPLIDWVHGLLAAARQWDASDWQASALAGARAVALSGTSLIADSSYSGAAAAAAASVGLKAVVAIELFGLNSASAEPVWRRWLEKLESIKRSAGRPLRQALASGQVKISVAPHAPYSVCPQLWQRARDWAKARSLPLLVHLAESDEERRWIMDSDQALDSFLATAVGAEIGPVEWKGKGNSPVRHLEENDLLTAGTVAAHCIKLNDEDIETLARRRVKVAHCPRSNARLHNGIAPLSRLLDAGVEVGFGTDSAASNDDLDILSEARFGLSLRRAVEPRSPFSAQDAVYMLTLGAARALGLESEVGSLEPGKKADIAVFDLSGSPSFGMHRPYDLLLHGSPSLRDLFVDGRQVVKNQQIC